MGKKFKGTQGVWKYNDRYEVIDIDGYIITKTIYTNGGTLEKKYNALLISKAPEMLEMLEYINSILGTSFEREKKEIQNLINSATEL